MKLFFVQSWCIWSCLSARW